MRLTEDFYLQKNVVSIARQLIGKELITCFKGHYTSGIITETEAYNGIVDKASHAYGGRRTARTEIMFRSGGIAYVYLCYGIHSLFNVVTNTEGIPHAVLIRSIQPKAGIEIMEQRRKKKFGNKLFANGPGTVSQALGIHYSQSGTALFRNEIWIEDNGLKISPKKILITPRIGVDYAQEDAALPYRFLVEGLL